MLEAFFVRMACQSYIEIDETFDLLTLSATEQTDFSLLSKLFEELKTISPRDKFELIIEIGGNTTAISGCHITDKVNLESHIEKYRFNNMDPSTIPPPNPPVIFAVHTTTKNNTIRKKVLIIPTNPIRNKPFYFTLN